MRRPAWGLLVLASSIAAQTPSALTAREYARAEALLPENTTLLVYNAGVYATWMPDGRFWYRAQTSDGFQFVTVDPAHRTRSASLSVATDSSTPPLAAPPNSSVSPDGKRAAYIKDYNLWVRDLATGRDAQLTTDGVKDYGYATHNAGWTTSDSPVLTWSPDSRKIATFQHDGRGVTDMYLVTTNVGAPRLVTWKYPLPGDRLVFRIRRVVIDIDAPGGPTMVSFQMPPDLHRSTVSDDIACRGGTVCDLRWFPDGSQVAFVSVSRDHKHASLRVADAKTGAVRTLFEERSATQIGNAAGLNQNLWRVLPASNELIWWSQRENWVQLYLYDLTTGRLKNRITTGDGNVDEIVRVDEKLRMLYYVANGKEPGRDPYFHHFYKVGLDGHGQMLLTRDNFDHRVQLSPDNRVFIDTYSTPDTPPVSVVRDASGRLVMTLEKADIARLLAVGWHPPIPITVKARDGQTDLYGLMFTPSRLDSTKKYPIVNYVYPQPSGAVGPRSFTVSRGDNQALAELGFVVVTLDGVGTVGRSKAFEDATYGHLEDNTIPDMVSGIRQLAQRYPWMDLTRVGIWGHSGGGAATARALFHFPDFYKVGIAESGNHDNRNYEDDWGERYQGLLPTTGYDAQANAAEAGNLKGKLLLIHGGMDDNVPPYNTYLVVEALERANKDYDLMILPNASHDYPDKLGDYVTRRRWDYLVKYLLGAEPPTEYQMGRPHGDMEH